MDGGESKMSTQTLKSELKKSLGFVDYPMMLVGGIFIAIMTNMLLIANHPELLESDLSSHVGFTLTIYIFLIGMIMGCAISIGISKYYKPQVNRIVNIPKDMESIKDQLITIGALVATGFPIDLNKKRDILSYINCQLVKLRKKLDRHDDRLSKVEGEVKKLREDYDNLYEFSGKQGQHIFALHWVLKRVLRENSKLVKENNELRQEKKETDKIVNDNALTKNNIIDTKNIHKENKFEELDE